MLALRRCNLRYVVLAGSLLGAVRSASILFCDDDIDIGIFEDEYEEALLQYFPRHLRASLCLFKDRGQVRTDYVPALPHTCGLMYLS